MARNERFIEFNGMMMTVRERNEILKMDYMRGEDIETIAEKYGLTVTLVADARKTGKWVAARKAYKERAKNIKETTVKQLYAGHKVTINVKYHNAWQKLMNIIEAALDDPEHYLMHEDGQVRWGAVSLVAELLTKAQNGQNLANGVMSREVELQLEMQREKLDLVKGQLDSGELDGAQMVNDNLVESINNAANVVFQDFTQKSQRDIARSYRKQARKQG